MQTASYTAVSGWRVGWVFRAALIGILMQGAAEAAIQGVRVRLVTPDSGAVAEIGDSVVVQVQYLAGTANVDSAVVAVVTDPTGGSDTTFDIEGDLAGKRVSESGFLGGSGTSSGPDSDGFLTISVGFLVVEGDPEVSNLAIQAYVMVMGDTSGTWYKVDNLSTDDVIEGSTSFGTVGDTSRFGVDGIPPQPLIDVSDSLVAFGNASLLGEPLSMTLTVSNFGAGTMVVSDIRTPDPDAATIEVSTQTFSLLPDQSLPVTVTLTPVRRGSIDTSLTIVSNDPLRTETPVRVLATITGPEIEVSDSTVVLGNVSLSGGDRILNITVSNPGEETLQVTDITLPAVTTTASMTTTFFPFALSSGASEVVEVTLSPESRGTYDANFVILSSDPLTSGLSVRVTATVISPVISISDTMIDFSSVDVGQSESRSITVRNTGDETLTVSGLSIPDTPDGSFEILPNAFSLEPNDSIDVKIDLSPTGAGIIQVDLTVSSDDPTNPQVKISVTATIVDSSPRFALLGPGIDFGNTNIGDFETRAFILENSGGVAGTIQDVKPDNSQLSVSGEFPMTVGAGEVVSIITTYRPESQRSRSGSISIFTDDPSNPLLRTSWLAGEVDDPALVLTTVVPADGERVETVTDIVLTFSEPLVFVGAFPVLDVVLHPKPLNADWKQNYVIDGGKITFLDVQLASNTPYRMTVSSALSVANKKLSAPISSVFTTGSGVVITGGIAGRVSLVRRVTVGQTTVVADTIDTVEGRVYAVAPISEQVVAETAINADGTYLLDKLPAPALYRVYAEVIGQDRLVAAPVNLDDNPSADAITVDESAVVVGQDIVVEDVEVVEGVVGQVSLDGDPAIGNQNASIAPVDANGRVRATVYVDLSSPLAQFDVVVHFDSEKFEFVGLGSDPEDLGESSALRGSLDNTRVLKVEPVVSGSLVDPDRIRITGRLLDQRTVNLATVSKPLTKIQDPDPVIVAFILDKIVECEALENALIEAGVDLSGPQTVQTEDGETVIPICTCIRLDYNTDGVVDLTDFLILSDSFGSSIGESRYDSRTDNDEDGMIGFSDFLALAFCFGETFGP